jgi:hypothetical protein
MYNPNNFELPDFQDPRLTDYVYSYDCLFTHAVGFRSEEFAETPWVEIEFFTPFRVRMPFHFLMWPSTPTIVEAEKVFELEQLNPKDPEFLTVKSQIDEFLRINPGSGYEPSVEQWYEEAQAAELDRIGVVEYRVRYTWKVRAWEGLTLGHLEAVKASIDEPLEFTKDFSVDDSVLILDTNEPQGVLRPAQLVLASDFDETEFEDSSKPGWSELDLSPYLFAPDKPGLWSRIRSLFRS